MEKNKVFSNSIVNFILLQMLGITFVCIMLFVDIFIDQDFTWLKLGMLSFTFLVFIVYEILITYFYRKHQKAVQTGDAQEKAEHEDEEEHKHRSHNEKYLWFLLMVLLDIILLVSVITTYININTYILLFITFAVFYAIAVFIRPYFGVVHHGE
jgi:FtsH-binding integral membrane protein